MKKREDFGFYAYLIKSDRRDYRLHWVKEKRRGGLGGAGETTNQGDR